MENCLLVRFGEVFLKKGNRRRFLDQLRSMLQDALSMEAGLENLKISAPHGRFLVTAKEDTVCSSEELDRAAIAISRVFGIVSVSPAATVESDFETIKEAAASLANREIEERPVQTFRVEARRTWKRFPMKSPDINLHVGARIIDDHPLPVRMKGADLVVGIEIHEEQTYIYARRLKGPGGLPVGSSGHAVLLLSGGIDSPVAGWMMAKRGCRLTAVHFHSYPYTTKKSLQKVAELAGQLARWHGRIRLLSMSITAIQEYFRDEVPDDKLVLFYRRTMIRLASRVARDRRARALVTGESLGQVASQTMVNIAVIQEAATVPVLQPLIGLDKVETVERAKRIGTFELSIQPYDDCCSLFLPPHPDTRGDIGYIKATEDNLEELERLEEEAYVAREERWIPA
jgi:tRNA uracil 4-sulfurtransferase